MSSQFGFSVQPDDAPRRKASGKAVRRPLMGGKQIEAYLLAREALRTIQRSVAQEKGRPTTRH